MSTNWWLPARGRGGDRRALPNFATTSAGTWGRGRRRGRRAAVAGGGCIGNPLVSRGMQVQYAGTDCDGAQINALWEACPINGQATPSVHSLAHDHAARNSFIGYDCGMMTQEGSTCRRAN